ncbi:DUF4062 domain-containing protein [Paenibacillus lautus]|uniref:DUF4062 domain-containing protein n=1 Tax=Paenibacillus lautus TaxID=1401 RepID=UPI003D2D6A94
MRKKLQVFISSTYTDLEEERQAAVQAVLNAGHIPAGMELFKSGDQSQKETIKRWIDESDVYLLILGGRYGTIDEETSKSYTHWEYDYAGEAGKPRFSVVIKDDALNEKVREHGRAVLELKYPDKYEAFKSEVTSKICRFYSDVRDIKLAIAEKLPDYERDESLYGWVSGREIPNVNGLLEVNEDLKRQLSEVKNNATRQNDYLLNGFEFEDVKMVLESNTFNNMSCLDYLISHKRDLINGIDFTQLLVLEFVPMIEVYGLAEKRNGVYYITKEGLWFIGKAEIHRAKARKG